MFRASDVRSHQRERMRPRRRRREEEEEEAVRNKVVAAGSSSHRPPSPRLLTLAGERREDDDDDAWTLVVGIRDLFASFSPGQPCVCVVHVVLGVDS